MAGFCHLLDELKIGGLEKTVMHIVFHPDMKYKQEVWCLKKKGLLVKEFENKGIRVKEFGFSGRFRILPFLYLIKELRKAKFKIIFCHGIYPSIWGTPAAFFAGIPLRFHYCHNIYSRLPKKDRIKLNILTHMATKIIAISNAVKMYLVESMGISPDKVELVHNSAPKCKYNLDAAGKANLKRQLGINDSDFVIGNISRLEARKGHRYLIEAMTTRGLRSLNCKCLIVGDGPEMQNLKNQIKSLNLEGIVIFTGERWDIEDLLSIMDIFVLPSISEEGLGICLAEAASMRLPLVGTVIDGIPEIIKDGVNGFVVPAANPDALSEKILYLMDNPEVRKKMGETSYQIWQERFTLDAMIKKINLLLLKVTRHKELKMQ